MNIFKVLALIALFLTYSRAALVILIILAVVLLLSGKIHIRIPKVIRWYYYLIPISFTLLFVYFTPFINARINSIPQAFEEGGSMDVRFKLLEEGINIVEQYPLTGVGLYRSKEEYLTSPYTEFFEKHSPVRLSGIHNTFLEMASEIGLPGLFLFILFLYSVIRYYLEGKKNTIKTSAFFGLLGLLGISMFNPFFHTSQFRIFFLLSAIILV